MPKRRNLSTDNQEWRKPQYEAHINKYPFALASLIAATAAVVIGLMISFVIIIAIWLFAAHGTESTIQVVRAAAIAWQSTHLVPVVIGEIPVGILPWGFAVIPGLIIWKTMHWALKSAQPTNGRQFWLIAIYFSGVYGLISAGVSLVSSTEGLKTSFIQGFLHTALIAVLISIAVLIDFAPSLTILTDRLPRDLVVSIRPGLIAFGILWFLSAVVTTGALIYRWDEVKAVSGLMAPSALDQIFLVLLCIGYLPTVITWTFSYLLGAGVHLGGSAVITTTIVTPGALPAFPLLSILPSEVLPWAKYWIVIPIAIGVALYFLVPREPWKAHGDSLPIVLSHVVRLREVIRIVLAVLVLAVATYFITAFSGGPLGTGYLTFVGPKPIEAVIAVIKVCGFAALGTLILPRLILSLIHWQTVRPRVAKVPKSVD